MAKINGTEYRTNYNIIETVTTLKESMALTKRFIDDGKHAISYGVRKPPKTPPPPEWLQNFVNKVNAFIDKVATFMTEQKTFNTQVSTFMTEQRAFNKQVTARLDNLVKLNNLKE